MTVKAIMPVRLLNPVEPLGHKPTAMRTTETGEPQQLDLWSGAVSELISAIEYIATHARNTRATTCFHQYLTPANAIGYTSDKSTAKKAVAGCESPKARGAKPHPARFAAFSILTTSYGGPNGRAQALPVTLRVPRSLTPVRAAAQCESWSAVVHLARLEIDMTHTTKPAPDIKRLRSAITDIDCIAQGGLSEISSIAKMALLWLESPEKSKHMDVIANALKMIWCRAEDVENCINCEAENVGCNWEDPGYKKRYEARLSEAQS